MFALNILLHFDNRILVSSEKFFENVCFFLDFCSYISYNIITVKERLTSKAGRRPERGKHGRYGNDR